MALVDYSDSDASGDEQVPVAKPPPPSKTKSTFTKVVDRSNPGKIKVSLPTATVKDTAQDDERPSKRLKAGGGGTFGGFNSFLPAPKRTGQAASSTLGGGQSKNVAIGSRINFKTGAQPAFERGDNYDVKTTVEEFGDNSEANSVDNETTSKPAEEVKLVGKPLMFRPLSVSRKPAKKKAVKPQETAPPPASITPQSKPAAPEKISLFSFSTESDSRSQTTPANSQDYKPIIYNRQEEDEEQGNEDSQDFEPSYEEYTPNASQRSIPPAAPTPPVSQSLSDIAGDLNLSAAERRQLFGRQKGGKPGQSATNVINFNTDQEYLHNEALRASGEQVVHNPVRSIAPGKHSLKQLVNAAQSQREALEESFAKGKSNRAEASSRYGW